jgi:chlorobactene lauroyltransferase
MLEARKSRWFEKIFSLYNRNLLKRRFNSFRVRGLDSLAARGEGVPKILYANHSGWWDGLVAFEISRAAGLDSYFMMEEKQLTRLRPFLRLGAFSIVREKPREALASVNYAASLLRSGPRRSLWIFPQGEILPNDVRPLRLSAGIGHIIEKTGACEAVPVAIRYEFRGAFKPDIFVSAGQPIPSAEIIGPGRKSGVNRLSEELTRLLEGIKEDLLAGELSDYRNLIG